MSRRKAHKRRYPRRKDGTRKSGYVKVSECDVHLGNSGCLLWFVLITSVLYLTF